MVRCYYCGKYKPESKMNRVVVGRGRNSSSKAKDGVDYVFSCGCYEERLERDSIDYLDDNGNIITKKLKIIIQKQISITPKEVDETITHYEKMSPSFRLCFGRFSGNKTDIIREIKKLSDIGKDILLLQYKYKTWEKGYRKK